MRKAIPLLLLSFLLTGCFEGDPEVTSGYVTAKAYDDPDDWTTRETDYRYSCEYEFGYNNRTGEYEYHNECKDRVSGHHTEYHHDGPHWTLTLRSDPVTEKGKKPKTYIGTVEVPEAIWTAAEIGNHYPDLR